MVKARSVALTTVTDVRGQLSAAQFPGDLPFCPRRVFIVSRSPAGTERGGHAHRSCHQLLIATAGEIVVEYDDDEGTGTATLTLATAGLHIPPLVWAKQTYVTDGSSLLVLASHEYDVDDYVDDRNEAAKLRTSAQSTDSSGNREG